MLTAHFKLREFTRSSEAILHGICNEAPLAVVSNLQHLCQEVLEPLRLWYGKPIVISSGYRCQALNKVVHGVTHSLHCSGEAADIVFPNVQDGWRLYSYLRDHLPHDELLWEHQGNKRWIHVALRNL